MTRALPDDLVCAVDVGTSAVRAALVDPEGRQQALVRRERPGDRASVAFDPEVLWETCVEVLAELLAGGARPRAVALAGHVGTVLLDAHGSPLGEGRGWADATGAADLEASWAADPARARRLGRPSVTGGAVPLLHHLRGVDRRTLDAVRWVLSPKDFLLLRLGAEPVTDLTSAAYTLGLDVAGCRWAVDVLEALGLPGGVWPHLHAAADRAGAVGARAAARTGLPAGTPLAVGGPDGSVGASAVLGGTPGATADVAGTTDVLTTLASSATPPSSSAVVNPWLVRGRWAMGGPTGMTGGALAHWSRLLGVDYADASDPVVRDAEELAPGCDGLSVTSTLSGSRFPDWDPSARGAVWGMSERHGRAHLLRASQEAAAYLVRSGIEALEVPPGPVLLAGGAARSASLTQLRADVLGRPVLACSEPDVSLLGAAMLAHTSAGTHPDLAAAQQAMVPPSREVVPDAGRAEVYEDLYQQWRSRRPLPR